MEFRKLRADEIDCRVSQISEKGLTLLLYKDARCDMNILDETVGCMNWKRSHTRENANCIVSIYDEEKKEWVGKEDTGTESFTEKEKGLASDSFKRACFNWGIGRELYTAPFIWISKEKCNIEKKNDKFTTYDKFRVVNIKYQNGEIIGLRIKNCRTNQVVFDFGTQEDLITEEQKEQMKKKFKPEDIKELLNDYDHRKLSEFTKEEAECLLNDGEK